MRNVKRMLRILHLIRHGYRRATFLLAGDGPPFVGGADIPPR